MGENTHLGTKLCEKMLWESSQLGEAESAAVVSWCARTSQTLVCWEGCIAGLGKSCPEAATGFHRYSFRLNIAEEEMPNLVLENKCKGGLRRFAALLSQPSSN